MRSTRSWKILKTQQEQQAELERISGLSTEEAKQVLLSDVEEKVRYDAALMTKEIETEAKENAEKMPVKLCTKPSSGWRPITFQKLPSPW